ncbi:hypothetical protein [Flavobacterium sp. FlaQc-30]|uniref:hypothetical protein n=1 Tax=Flavobacterium sp. FlaQc-30 TaxID=3374179 RepID=UPI003756C8F5
MTLADLIKDFIDTTKERLKTPISGAFLWSFIIYNWRPLFLLLFSSASIEDKIIVINHEYCNFWAIFWPIVIATFYTLFIPKIMLLIDKDLAPTKDERVTTIYESKKHLIIEKTKVAHEEFLLKNAESGNKEIQNLQDENATLKGQISTLQDSIKQINETNKASNDQVNNSLKTANETISKLQLQIAHSNDVRDSVLAFKNLRDKIIREISSLDTELAKESLKIVDSLSFDEYLILKQIDNNTTEPIHFDRSPNTIITLEDLSNKKVLTYRVVDNGLEVTFTDSGLIILNTIKSI